MPKVGRTTEITSADMQCLYGLAVITRLRGSREGGFPALSVKEISDFIMRNSNVQYTYKVIERLWKANLIAGIVRSGTSCWYIKPAVLIAIEEKLQSVPCSMFLVGVENGDPD